MRDNQLYAKVKKCVFNKEDMTFAGYMVSKTNTRMDPAKVSAFPNRPVLDP